MWIFTSSAFCSLVQHWKKPNHLVARARFAGHLETLFPGARVRTTSANDYRYRCIVTKQRAADVYAKAIMNIGYPNFKDSITDPRLHDAASEVWGVMFRAQHRAAPARRRPPIYDDVIDDEGIDVDGVIAYLEREAALL